MKKFEYEIEHVNFRDGTINITKRFNELGNEGWELVSQEDTVFYFKRKKYE